MTHSNIPGLSKREQQIMDCVYKLGKATGGEIRNGIPDAPSYSAVRALLRILVEKGHLRHKQNGQRYVYFPTRSKSAAGGPALKRVMNTFFEGSMEKTVAALLKVSGPKLSSEQLDHLQSLIDQAKTKERKS